MTMRVLRATAAVLLAASGALMYAASRERWAGACSWFGTERAGCATRQDHRYDFVPPTAPWEPLGNAAQLAGWSLLVLALGFVLLPWALTGRRPALLPAAAVVGAVLALTAVGVATLRSGMTGNVVHPFPSDLVWTVWALLPTAVLIWFAVAARGWAARAAAISLTLATPLVAAFSYAVGPYDAQPWWEAISGLFTAAAGLCLLGAAAFGDRGRTRRSDSQSAAPPPWSTAR